MEEILKILEGTFQDVGDVGGDADLTTGNLTETEFL